MERRKFTREFKLEAVRLIKDRGVSYVQASQDLSVHPSQLRDWVKKFADDPQHAFPGHGQMRPERLEIGRLTAEGAEVRGARVRAGWLLCLTDTRPQSAQPQRRRAWCEGPHQLPGERPDLWRQACVARLAGGWAVMWAASD